MTRLFVAIAAALLASATVSADIVKNISTGRAPVLRLQLVNDAPDTTTPLPEAAAIGILIVAGSALCMRKRAPARFGFLLALITLAAPLRSAPVQWPTSQGGNGHYYDWVPGTLSWTDAKNAAASSTFGGVHGYLATITTQSENDFFASQFSQTSGQTLIGWLGGFQDRTAPDYSEPAGGWRWVTGEPWSYTSWWTAKGLPDDFGGHQDFLRTQPVGSTVYWDDIQENPGSGGVAGYFVEYPVPEPAALGVLILGGLVFLTRVRRGGVGTGQPK